MKTILMAVVSLVLRTTPVRTQGALTVNVTGFKTDEGQCKIWFFNSADGFPTDDKKSLRCVDIPIERTHLFFDEGVISLPNAP